MQRKGCEVCVAVGVGVWLEEGSRGESLHSSTLESVQISGILGPSWDPSEKVDQGRERGKYWGMISAKLYCYYVCMYE